MFHFYPTHISSLSCYLWAQSHHSHSLPLSLNQYRLSCAFTWSGRPGNACNVLPIQIQSLILSGSPAFYAKGCTTVTAFDQAVTRPHSVKRQRQLFVQRYFAVALCASSAKTFCVTRRSFAEMLNPGINAYCFVIKKLQLFLIKFKTMLYLVTEILSS